MGLTHLPFSALDWRGGAHPLERKKLVDGQLAALVEFATGFEDPNWCVRQHVIYVVDGALELQLDCGSAVVTGGNGCVIDAGTRHRARNSGPGPVRLFIISG